MKTLLVILLATCATSLCAQQPFVEITMYQGTNQTGYIRMPCKDKTDAIALTAKYTLKYATNQTVWSRLHICNHDLRPCKECTVQDLVGKEPTKLLGLSKEIVGVLLKTPENIAMRDNQVQMSVPATKAMEDALITKIVAEEFAGKAVTTNKTATAAGGGK